MKWIKCSDRLPEASVHIQARMYKKTPDKFFFTDGHQIHLGKLIVCDDGRRYYLTTMQRSIFYDDITHWLEIEMPND